MNIANPEHLRLTIFVVLFIVLAAAEHIWPRRPLTVAKTKRWSANIGIIAVDSLLLKYSGLLLPVGAATLAATSGWGMFHVVTLPWLLELLLTLLLLDLAIYIQHRQFHRIPLLWRFHRMHHTDLDLDVSSGNRFHPVEIFISVVFKITVVLITGASPTAVLLFEIILNATAMFNHANLYIPLTVDAWLRWLLVTPDMHRVHHSTIPGETDSNFGFNIPLWDRIFGTYTAQPRLGHDLMTIGLNNYRHQEELTLYHLLLLPFTSPPARRPS